MSELDTSSESTVIESKPEESSGNLDKDNIIKDLQKQV